MISSRDYMMPAVATVVAWVWIFALIAIKF